MVFCDQPFARKDQLHFEEGSRRFAGDQRPLLCVEDVRDDLELFWLLCQL